MGIKPTSGNHVVIPPDNTQSRWGEWEAELSNKGDVAGEVITETWALADSANKVASKALSDAQSAIESSGEANAELEALLDPNNVNSALWQLQWQINEYHRIAIENNARAINEMTQYITRHLWTQYNVPASNDYFSITWAPKDQSHAATITAKGSWSGVFNILYMIATPQGEPWSMYQQQVALPNPQQTRSVTTVANYADAGGLTVFYQVNPGTAIDTTLESLEARAIGNAVWTTLLTWTVPEDTSATVLADLRWLNKTLGGSYAMRITHNGENIVSSESSHPAPLFGHATRSHSVLSRLQSFKAGDLISIDAYASHSNEINRRLDQARASITWIQQT